MMQEAVEKSGGEGRIVIEDLRPLLEDPVRSQNDGTPLIALTDDLEQQIGTGLVDRQVADLLMGLKCAA